MSDSTVRSEADEAWDDLLRQLRSQPKARPRPFFYGRVHARLTAPAARPTLLAWLRRPAYAALLAALVLSLSGDGSGLRPDAAVTARGAASDYPPPR
ncbi:hypothetical protein [Hymenobacter ruricola]|uniref:Uncharacterized protein n=1 Tax=Hymenobacter ruricola TaxID=2791023 RepID=A0ABS0I5J4_9BACT|nr:hypothetical protein [Hymenobacter ruricola]MBF9222235.1 hypothetical protein [Hymenobacter ruricola]